MRASENIIDAQSVLHFGGRTPEVTEASVGEALKRAFDWSARDNLYRIAGRCLLWTSEQGPQSDAPLGPGSLGEWLQLWDTAETGAREGQPGYRGGDLLTRLATNPETITPEDFRLSADSAGYRAGPDGKDLGADVDLVGPGAAYERWKQTPEYQDWLEETGQLRTAAPAPESEAFVLLAGQGEEVRKFDTLADAVLGASDGDTIEIRGNGPFVMPPIVIHQSLAIRAGKGFWPVIRLQPGAPGDDYLIMAHAPLVLEGLEIREVSAKRSQPAQVGRSVIYCDAKSLHLGNCRLEQEEPTHEAADLILGCSRIVLRNCQFRNANAHYVAFGNDAPVRLVMDNCLGAGGSAVFLHYAHVSHEARLEFRGNTLVTQLGAELGFSVAPDPALDSAEEKRIQYDASGNVFDARLGMFEIDAVSKLNWQAAGDAEAMFAPFIGWRDQRNVYSPSATAIFWSPRQSVSLPLAAAGLQDWERRWDQRNTGSVEGEIRFQGGDLIARARSAPEKLTAEDFRLRADSAGYRAGPDGKDLGAYVDLVGPGPAYERWKQTPDYQEWLEETGQQRAEVPQADDRAAVEEDIKKLSERIEKSPDDHSARIARAQLYTRQRQWRAAADDLGRAGEAVLSDPADAFLYAILLVHLHESSLHRQFCERMLDRFGSTTDVWTANCLVKSCLLQPGIVDPSSLPVNLLSEDREFATNEPQWVLREARALVAYRSGKFEEARRLVRETLALPAYKNDPLYAPRALSILAMATHKSGETQLARDLYEQARQQFDKNQLAPGHPAAICWAFADILRREAAQELGVEEISLDGAAARELAKWQGEWENAVYGRLVINGDRWSSYPKDGFEVVSKIKIVEVTDEMTHILLLSAGVDGKVRTIQTILRVDGDTLHNCGTIGSVRPTEFANKPGFIYTQWKRVSSPPP